MNSIDIYDFSYIKKAPEAKKKHDLEKVIKIYMNENDSSLNKGFAIDFKESHVYVDTGMGSRGIRTSREEPVNVIDINGVIDILKKYDVQNWKENYTFEDPDSYQDGYSWKLWLQFEDGTVEKHTGSGTDVKKITPDNFSAFRKELTNFVDENLNKE